MIDGNSTASRLVDEASKHWFGIFLPAIVLGSLTTRYAYSVPFFLLCALPSFFIGFKNNRYDAIDIALLLYIGSGLLGYWHTAYTFNTIQSLSIEVSALVLYFAMRAYSDSNIFPIYITVCIAAIWHSSWAIAHWFSTYLHLRGVGFTAPLPFRRFLNSYPSIGYSGNDGLLAIIYCGVSTIALISMAQSSITKWIAGISVALCVMWIALTMSRTLYLSVACGLLVAVAIEIFSRYRSKWTLDNKLGIFTIYACLVLFAVFLVAVPGLWDSSGQMRSVLGRTQSVIAGLSLARKYAIWGAGPGNYSYVSCLGGGIENDTCNSQVFNWYVQSLIERGILGLLAALYLALVTVRVATRHFKVFRARREWAVVALASSVALCVFNLGQAAYFSRVDLAVAAVTWFIVIRNGGQP